MEQGPELITKMNVSVGKATEGLGGRLHDTTKGTHLVHKIAGDEEYHGGKHPVVGLVYVGCVLREDQGRLKCIHGVREAAMSHALSFSVLCQFRHA